MRGGEGEHGEEGFLLVLGGTLFKVSNQVVGVVRGTVEASVVLVLLVGLTATISGYFSDV